MANPREQAATEAVGAGQPSNGRSGVFKLLLEQHCEAFAQVKKLGMRSEEAPGWQEPLAGELTPSAPRSSPECAEMAEGYAALRAVVRTELALRGESASDLADAMAALDAINPGSPEWGPAFLQLSELVEARGNEEQSEFFSKSNEPELRAAG
ncbi:MAG TPA: hypothetical protein VGC79_36155 [Polyangiaceae bacterium]